ncbi:CYTH and CHAD domain-containing protein [Actinospica sp.]|uniref:CYTH and CHAD domain-containing protein n=1 Tax=Actinospica sp. TaxID=1872142 RepID=UPI002C1623A1|nr:CYTH and CHAD domain-containing protein [Actinospica sp.]HWG23674.1 CYTH and CHAD domain-containing protein [Actinospica sp.]
MATVMRETERKYEAPPGARLPDLRSLPGVAAQSEADEVRLEATYYDTASYDLARAGITLRHRVGGHDAGWHLKIPAGDAETRTELRLASDAEMPTEFTDLLTGRLRGRTPRAVATITTRRRASTLVDVTGDPLAEVALDSVTAEALGGTAVLTRWTEIEVELAEGVEDGGELLKAADRTLRRSGLRRSTYRMKLEAALSASDPRIFAGPRPSSRKPASAGEVVRAYFREQFEELLSWDVQVRRAQPDAIHQMRVAARRMRSALREFRPLFTSQNTNLESELRWLGRELSGARDEEVLRDLLLDELARIPAESVLGPVRARVGGNFASRLAEGERHVADVLRSRRYIELLEALDAFAADTPLNADADRRATGALPSLVRHSQRRVKRRMRAARHASGEAHGTALHDVRKAAKRARYAAEVASLASGKKARKSAKALKKLASTLGEHHDSVIAAGELRGLATRANSEGETSYTYGVLHERMNERARRFAERAEDLWSRADRRKRTAWMK